MITLCYDDIVVCRKNRNCMQLTCVLASITLAPVHANASYILQCSLNLCLYIIYFMCRFCLQYIWCLCQSRSTEAQNWLPTFEDQISRLLTYLVVFVVDMWCCYYEVSVVTWVWFSQVWLSPNLHLASSKQWCWSGGREILTELSLCYSLVLCSISAMHIAQS